jgi:hypothetical protein
MEANKVNIKKILSKLITEKRDEVINALRLSNVAVNDTTDDRGLYSLVLSELKKGNNKFIYNLGYVLDSAFDLTDVAVAPYTNMGAVKLEGMSLAENQLQGINNLDADYSNTSGGFTITNPDEFNQMNQTTTPTKPSTSWWQKNKGNIGSGLTAGVGLLGSIFGGGKDTSTPTVAPSNNSSGMLQMMQNQQNIANQQAREDAQRRADEDSRRRTNMMIFGGIGGVVVLGLVVFLAVRNK